MASAVESVNNWRRVISVPESGSLLATVAYVVFTVRKTVIPSIHNETMLLLELRLNMILFARNFVSVYLKK